MFSLFLMLTLQFICFVLNKFWLSVSSRSWSLSCRCVFLRWFLCTTSHILTAQNIVHNFFACAQKQNGGFFLWTVWLARETNDCFLANKYWDLLSFSFSLNVVITFFLHSEYIYRLLRSWRENKEIYLLQSKKLSLKMRAQLTLVKYNMWPQEHYTLGTYWIPVD